MTKEEREKAIDVLEHNWTRLVNADYSEEELNTALNTALEVLRQGSGEDAISRKEVYEQINCWIGSGEYKYTNATDYLTKRIANLSSVRPTQKG